MPNTCSATSPTEYVSMAGRSMAAACCCCDCSNPGEPLLLLLMLLARYSDTSGAANRWVLPRILSVPDPDR